MPDLPRQIRERLDAPTLTVEVPDKWTVGQIEAFRRELREHFGTGVRIVPVDPPSDTATPEQMRAALLAVLDAVGPRSHLTPSVRDRVHVAVAKALGIEVDRG